MPASVQSHPPAGEGDGPLCREHREPMVLRELNGRWVIALPPIRRRCSARAGRLWPAADPPTSHACSQPGLPTCRKVYVCSRWPCNHCSSFCPVEVALVPLRPRGRPAAAAAAPAAAAPQPEPEPVSPMAGERCWAALAHVAGRVRSRDPGRSSCSTCLSALESAWATNLLPTVPPPHPNPAVSPCAADGEWPEEGATPSQDMRTPRLPGEASAAVAWGGVQWSGGQGRAGLQQSNTAHGAAPAPALPNLHLRSPLLPCARDMHPSSLQPPPPSPAPWRAGPRAARPRRRRRAWSPSLPPSRPPPSGGCWGQAGSSGGLASWAAGLARCCPLACWPHMARCSAAPPTHPPLPQCCPAGRQLCAAQSGGAAGGHHAAARGG